MVRTRMLCAAVAVAVALAAPLAAQPSTLGRQGVAAPIPAQVRGPEAGPAGYHLQALGDGLFWVTRGPGAQALFLVRDSSVVVVDAPPSLGDTLSVAIRSVTALPVTHVVYTHAHRDHIGAAAQFARPGVAFVGHAETAAQLRRARDPRPAPPGYRAIPPVTTVFTDSLVLGSGDRRLRLRYPGPNHTAGNIIVHAPRQRVVMMTDVVVPGWPPPSYLSSASDRVGWVAVHDSILAYDFDTFVGGHFTRLGSRADVEAQRDFLVDLRDAVDAAIREVRFADAAAGLDPANLYQQAYEYQNEISRECERRMLPRWRANPRMAAADVDLWKNCFAMYAIRAVDY